MGAGKRTCVRFVFLFSIFQFVRISEATSIVSEVYPHQNFKAFRQFPEENICWALASKAIIRSLKRKDYLACDVVGRTRGQSCCDTNNSVKESCNEGGQGYNALRTFGVSVERVAPNFAGVYATLRSGGLVTLITDMRNSIFGSRAGHESVIYRAQYLSDGSYTFYVGDSANGYYSFNSADLELKANGTYEYISLDISFTWEASLYAH
jgi:hypothetical protein